MAIRRSLSKSMQLRVWYRDRWHCSYCGQAVLFSPTLKLLDGMSPGRGYYSRHGKRGDMLAMFENLCASCDHVVSVAAGGDNSLDNLVAACFACNREKGSGALQRAIDVAGLPARPFQWDGLVSLYPKLPGAAHAWTRCITAEESEWEIKRSRALPPIG